MAPQQNFDVITSIVALVIGLTGCIVFSFIIPAIIRLLWETMKYGWSLAGIF